MDKETAQTDNSKHDASAISTQDHKDHEKQAEEANREVFKKRVKSYPSKPKQDDKIAANALLSSRFVTNVRRQQKYYDALADALATQERVLKQRDHACLRMIAEMDVRCRRQDQKIAELRDETHAAEAAAVSVLVRSKKQTDFAEVIKNEQDLFEELFSNLEKDIADLEDEASGFPERMQFIREVAQEEWELLQSELDEEKEKAKHVNNHLNILRQHLMKNRKALSERMQERTQVAKKSRSSSDLRASIRYWKGVLEKEMNELARLRLALIESQALEKQSNQAKAYLRKSRMFGSPGNSMGLGFDEDNVQEKPKTRKTIRKTIKKKRVTVDYDGLVAEVPAQGSGEVDPAEEERRRLAKKAASSAPFQATTSTELLNPGNIGGLSAARLASPRSSAQPRLQASPRASPRASPLGSPRPSPRASPRPSIDAAADDGVGSVSIPVKSIRGDMNVVEF